MRIQDGLCQMPLPERNDEPNSPISAMSATMNSEYVASNAQPAKNPARGPSVAPASAYVEPAWLKYLVNRMNEYEMSAIAIAANRNASGTARPMRLAGTVPLSAIAAVGAMIPTEIATASRNAVHDEGFRATGPPTRLKRESPSTCLLRRSSWG